MSLIVKPPSWGHCTTNFTGTPSTSAVGTNFTSGANNGDGTAASVLSSISHDVEYLVIGIHGIAASGENGSALLDVLIDPAGGSSWSSFIDDLIAGECPVAGAAGGAAYWYHFPIWLKSGHSIGVQCRTARATDITTGRVVIFAYGGNRNPGSWWCGQSVTSVGITAASSRGTNHTAGNSGAFSSWTNFGSALPAPAGALQFAVQGTNTDTTQNAAAYYFEFGAGSTRIGPPLFRGTSTTEQGVLSPQGVIFYEAPSGLQLQVRGTCSGTAEQLDVAAYAVH